MTGSGSEKVNKQLLFVKWLRGFSIPKILTKKGKGNDNKNWLGALQGQGVGPGDPAQIMYGKVVE